MVNVCDSISLSVTLFQLIAISNVSPAVMVLTLLLTSVNLKLYDAFAMVLDCACMRPRSCWPALSCPLISDEVLEFPVKLTPPTNVCVTMYVPAVSWNEFSLALSPVKFCMRLLGSLST